MQKADFTANATGRRLLLRVRRIMGRHDRASIRLRVAQLPPQNQIVMAFAAIA
jgi:hypothetical protein